MKITYNQNPMAATIELDEHEKRELWNRIKIKEMDDMLYEAHFYLTKNYLDLDRVREAVDPDYYMAETGITKLDERVNTLYEYALGELDSEHCGDCTCVACSCSKCWLEGMLGICTTEGLNKHPGHKVSAAFKDETATLESVIAKWEAAEPFKATEAWHEGHTDRWTRERNHALEWLKEYRTLLGTTRVTPLAPSTLL